MMPGLIWGAVTLVFLGAAYLLGSFPTGYLVAKRLQGIDIREHGSGSTGATNVLRVLGKGPGLVVFAADVAKGAIAIALVPLFFQGIAAVLPTSFCWLDCPSWFSAHQDGLYWVRMLAGFAALLGHSKSIFLRFTGGKSVATSLGILLVLHWPVAIATFASFGMMLALSRIVSLSSITGAIALPIWMLVFNQPLPYLVFAIAGSIYVVLRHSSNIQRLLKGTEPKLGQG
ncbi:glycerol-3-phosphate 1-O-acyltransferase PlsY [Lyngbya confervoides]|uniref:Glycerol-3-phosphate acyltransferase n=1 Tax=Lyngbya confervoides BDU141951 TaxID=1574623 RepID=A0ABD4T0G4_9CYAN|nr:glycerol-3-phosphate 1-O-acyltransferase PlsY [Lyngbya confervoides]MCM1982100.1 glycerol-3-phosphate 1-O-acyltransferase PlsY [Lyngbya confervoides BDU141951]